LERRVTKQLCPPPPPPIKFAPSSPPQRQLTPPTCIITQAKLSAAHAVALQVKINVECRFVRDVLRGDDVTEMRVKLISAPPETYPYQDDD